MAVTAVYFGLLVPSRSTKSIHWSTACTWQPSAHVRKFPLQANRGTESLLNSSLILTWKQEMAETCSCTPEVQSSCTFGEQRYCVRYTSRQEWKWASYLKLIMTFTQHSACTILCCNWNQLRQCALFSRLYFKYRELYKKVIINSVLKCWKK